MWQAIQYVSSGLTLVAFVVAAIVGVLRSKIREKERLIKTAGESDRASLVKDALEFFSVDTSNLSKDRQFDVAMAQIRARQLRFTMIIFAVIVLALIGACLAAYAMSKTGHRLAADVSPSSPGDAQSSVETQKEQFRLQRRTELIGVIFETTDGPDGKPRPRANARARSEALREFVEMERVAKGDPASDFVLDLRGARLEGVKVQNLDFTKAGFEGANLDGADFYLCNFTEAVLYNTTAREAEFFDCDLSRANCKNAIWPKAKLTHTTLASANFEGADLQGITTHDVILKETKLASSVLRSANLAGIRDWQELGSIEGADIRGVIRPPEGFVEWAKKTGAVEAPPERQQKQSSIEGTGRRSKSG
jgi:uncharacterized protein YjbI with pentapeptide repeats